MIDYVNVIDSFLNSKAGKKKPVSIDKIYQNVEMEKMKTGSTGLTDDDKKLIDEAINDGLNDLKYYKTPKGKIVLFNRTSFRAGRFYGTRNGDGIVKTAVSYTNRDGERIEKEEKYKIEKGACNGAIDNDYVLIDTYGYNGKPKIEKIIKRNLESVAGEVAKEGNFYYLIPSDKKKRGLTIALHGEYSEGQKVLVNLTKQTANNFYIGEVVSYFRPVDDDILWEAYKCGIDNVFSEESMEELDKISDVVTPEDKVGREDLTNLKFVTIDGDDTKDFDDAVCYRKSKKGNDEVIVSIADVSYYVKRNSALDRDAYRKGTSSYLADTVLPMLPPKLSNGICSLNPGVERLTISCFMELDKNGNVIDYRISPTVIKSHKRMTYKKVNDLLKNGIVAEGYEDFVEDLNSLNEIAHILRKKRLKNGSIEFDKPELKIIYDKEGHPQDFSIRVQDDAENLIEEFMLLANETVDKHLVSLGLPCLHRVHGMPDGEKIKEFLKMLIVLKIPFNKYSAEECANIPKAFQALAKHISSCSSHMQSFLSTAMIKCMARAKYSPNNIGHFGLQKDEYLHFTSPIRRYPDLVIHRIIRECCFDKVNSARNAKKWDKDLLDIGYHTSKMEKQADECEKNVLYMKCSEYMENHIGEEYDGTIICMSDRGLHVELDNYIEGRVRIYDLPGLYKYNPETFTMESFEGNDNYSVGDRIHVKVKAASKEEKTIDFEVIEKIIPDINENDLNKTFVKRKFSS